MKCLCGCGASLEGLRSDARYASDACRAKAHKRGVQGAPRNYDPGKFWAGYSRAVAAGAENAA